MRVHIRREAILTILATSILVAALAAGATSRLIPCLSGFVRDSGGGPIAGVDLDFFDSITGEKLITPGDNTDATGFYNVCVLPGIYDVSFAPPPGARLRGKVFRERDMRADAGVALDVVLESGTVIVGTATTVNGGLPVAGVDIDVDEVGGPRIFTPDDNTDLNGDYRLVIPDGMFRFRYEPLPGSRLRGVQRDSIIVLGDATLDVELPEGLLLTGGVSNLSGIPLPDVDIDLRDWTTSRKVFVANNTTDASGAYSIAVPAGNFELRFVPERSAPLVATVHDSFVITSDSSLDEALETGHVVTVDVRDQLGAAVPGADLDVKIVATGEKIFTPHDMTDAGGSAVAVLLTDTYRLQIEPPSGASLGRVVIDNVLIVRDTTITIALPEAVRVTATGRIVDESAAGVEGVELEARILSTDRKVFIPDPFTDASGAFSLSIPVESYNVFVAPALGSRLIAIELPNVEVAADTTWGVIPLVEGVLVRIGVRTPSGAELSGADVDVIHEATQRIMFTPHDNTSPGRPAEAALAPDRYTFRVSPPPTSPYTTVSVTDVSVTQDTLLVITLSADSEKLPPGAMIGLAYPNPFLTQVTIPYTISQPSIASIKVYNLAGQLVRELVKGFHSTDAFETLWNGTDESGSLVASGVYLVRLDTDVGQHSRKIILVR